tara:strand:- start:34 stop:567 length:534 start_codon:yes stop_codon:yes gene_type:complete
MNYNVAQFLQEPTGSVRHYRVQEEIVFLGDVNAKCLEGWLKFTRTDSGIWIKGPLAMDVSTQCSRCLEEFDVQLKTEITEEFYPTVVPKTGSVVADPVIDEEAFLINLANELDTREAVRQHVVSILPMKPLCKRDCAGICPHCGVNSNEVQCHCDVTPMDSRWERLIELLPSTEKGS